MKNRPSHHKNSSLSLKILLAGGMLTLASSANEVKQTEVIETTQAVRDKVSENINKRREDIYKHKVHLPESQADFEYALQELEDEIADLDERIDTFDAREERQVLDEETKAEIYAELLRERQLLERKRLLLKKILTK